jgi:hypothetical protein
MLALERALCVPLGQRTRAQLVSLTAGLGFDAPALFAQWGSAREVSRK